MLLSHNVSVIKNYISRCIRQRLSFRKMTKDWWSDESTVWEWEYRGLSGPEFFETVHSCRTRKIPSRHERESVCMINNFDTIFVANATRTNSCRESDFINMNESFVADAATERTLKRDGTWLSSIGSRDISNKAGRISFRRRVDTTCARVFIRCLILTVIPMGAYELQLATFLSSPSTVTGARKRVIRYSQSFRSRTGAAFLMLYLLTRQFRRWNSNYNTFFLWESPSPYLLRPLRAVLRLFFFQDVLEMMCPRI